MTKWEDLPESDRWHIVQGMRRQLRRIATDINIGALGEVGSRTPGRLGELLMRTAAFGKELEAELEAIDGAPSCCAHPQNRCTKCKTHRCGLPYAFVCGPCALAHLPEP